MCAFFFFFFFLVLFVFFFVFFFFFFVLKGFCAPYFFFFFFSFVCFFVCFVLFCFCLFSCYFNVASFLCFHFPVTKVSRALFVPVCLLLKYLALVLHLILFWLFYVSVERSLCFASDSLFARLTSVSRAIFVRLNVS